MIAGVLLIQVIFKFLCSIHNPVLNAQVTIHESREGLAVWLLWGLFELVMKVFEDMSLKVTIHLKVVNLLNDIKYFFNHLVWIHQVSIGFSA